MVELTVDPEASGSDSQSDGCVSWVGYEIVDGNAKKLLFKVVVLVNKAQN